MLFRKIYSWLWGSIMLCFAFVKLIYIKHSIGVNVPYTHDWFYVRKQTALMPLSSMISLAFYE